MFLDISIEARALNSRQKRLLEVMENFCVDHFERLNYPMKSDSVKNWWSFNAKLKLANCQVPKVASTSLRRLFHQFAK